MKKTIYLVLLVLMSATCSFTSYSEQTYKKIIMTNLDAFKAPLKGLGNANNIANSYNTAYKAVGDALALDTTVLSKENIDNKFKTANASLQTTRDAIYNLWTTKGSLFTSINFDFDAKMATIQNDLKGAAYMPTITKAMQDLDKQLQQVSGDTKKSIDLHVAVIKNSIDTALADASLVITNKGKSDYAKYKKIADASFDIARLDLNALKGTLDKQKALNSNSISFDYAMDIENLKNQLSTYINFLGD